MLGILLTILKVIGIIILCILGLVLGILLIVFLVPIRYNVQGDIYEEYNIKVKVHWLLHLLHIVVQLKGKVIEISVRVFGFQLFSMKKEPEQSEVDEVKNQVNNQDDVQENITEEQVSEEISEEVSEEVSEGTQELVEIEDNVEEIEVQEEYQEENLEEKPIFESVKKIETVDERTLSEKIEDKLNELADKIADKCENIEKTIEDLQDKIEKIKKTVTHYLDLISHERTKRLLKRVFKEIGGIFVHIAPRKLKANLHIGMDNPATTGQICMYASMLYPIYKDNIQLEPDFEEKVLEGTFACKGRIRLGHFIAMIIRIVFNRDFLYVITHIKQKADKKENTKTSQA